MAFSNRPFVVLALVAAAFPFTLTGCSTSFSPTLNEPGTYTIHGIEGTVFGGQQPVTGASIYLYATGTSGLYSNSRSVLTSAVLSNSPGFSGIDGNSNYFVTTSSTGHFSITGDYTCSTGESLYLYAAGGNSGAGSGSNSHIGMLAALGTCASNSGDLSTQVPSIQVNEVSTIATAFALAGFAHTPTAIGSGASATAQQAMANAFANVPNIYNYSAGMPLSTTPGSTADYTGTVPSNKMLWLADIIAACLNTDPADSNSTCAGLFAAMPDPNGGTTADTAQVALNMAHTQSPAANIITGLTILIPPQPAFAYTPTTYTDLALPIVYTSPLASAGGMAIDRNGYVWAFDYNSNISASTIYKISPQGVGSSITPASPNSDILSFAISPHDDSVWAYNESTPEIDGYRNDGTFIIQADVPDGVPTPGGIAFNGSGDFFFSAGAGGPDQYFLEEDGPDGFQVLFGTGGSGFSGTALTTFLLPFVSLDSNQAAWLSGTASNNPGNDTFYKYNSPYTSKTASFSNTNYYNPLVAGANGVMWYPDQDTGLSLDSYTSSGGGIPCTGGGINGPQTVTVDGAGQLWNGNFQDSSVIPTPNQTISGFNPLNGGSCAALTTSAGIGNGVDPSHGAVPWYIAADSSGNLWTLDFGVDNVTNPTVNVTFFTQFLGLSVPAVTPINPALVGTTPQ